MTENLGGMQSGPYGAPVQVQGPPPPAAKGLALAALVVGIVAFVLGLIPVLGLLIGAGAIVLGILALKREQSKPMALTGAILGGLAALTSIIMTIVMIFAADDFTAGVADGVAESTAEATVEAVAVDLVAVPDVTGMTVSEAITVLKGAGFVIDNSGAGASDIVSGTTPAAGAEAAAGDTIVVTAEPPMVAVPDVIGMAVSEAASALSDAGLTLNAGDSPDVDVISEQTPAAGAEAHVGDMVTVTAAPRPVDKAAYVTLGDRDFGLIGKDPDAHIGEKVVLYGDIFQFDSFTGKCGFMANTGPAQLEDSWGYAQNTAALAGDGDTNCPILDTIIEGDIVKMWATVGGSYDYDTQIGGSTTAMLIQVDAIEYISSGD